VTQGDLANAPLIDTDIPTSDVYLNQAPTYYNSGGVAGLPAGNDMQRRYFFGGGSSTAMISMDNVPAGFGINASQKGIAGIYVSRDYSSGTTLRMVIHKPIPDVKGFITNWDEIPGVSLYIPPGNANISNYGAGVVASQRQGQYVYAFMYYARLGVFSDSFSTNVYKVSRDEYVQSVGIAGGSQALDGHNTDATEPIITVNNGGQFFVSDEEQPFIWNISGSIAFGGTAQMTGFRDDDSGDIGSYYSQYDGSTGNRNYYYYGQSAAFLQRFALPSDMYGYGPYLVHPWASGSYDPPELWFFITEFDASGFRTTGRFRIYRSRWKKGVYKAPNGVNLGDDPDYMSGKTSFPKLNPRGYGWETDIWDDNHLVGVVGPFDMTVYNPKKHALATIQNSTVHNGNPIGSNQGLPFGFKVVRDHKRYGTLHVIAMDGGTYPSNGTTLNRVWFANSADDGQNWSRMTQISPAISPATQGTAQGGYTTSGSSPTVSRTGIPQSNGLQASESVTYSNYNGSPSPSIVRTHDDVLLMGNLSRYTTYTFADGTTPPYYAEPADAGGKVALAIIDYTGRGIGSYDKNTVVFAQQATRGQIAWQ
jgi:hypothetical protein